MNNFFYVSYQLGPWHMDFLPVSYAFDIYDSEEHFLITLKTAMINLSKDCAIHFGGDSKPYQIFPDYKTGNDTAKKNSTIEPLQESNFKEYGISEDDWDGDDERYSVEFSEFLTAIDKRLEKNLAKGLDELPSYLELGDFQFSLLLATHDWQTFCRYLLKTIIAEIDGEEVFDELRTDYLTAEFFLDMDESYLDELPIVRFIAEHFEDEVFPEEDFVLQFRYSEINERESSNLGTLSCLIRE